MLNGIKNFLEFVNNNWTSIVIIVGLVIAMEKKVKTYLKKTDNEKIEIAKRQIKEIVLKLVSDAEIDYEQWSKAGGIKRSQVLNLIYEKYPVLSQIADQDTVVEWIDKTIDESLKTMREIFDENKKLEESN